MLDLFGWDVGMSTLAATLLVFGALILGLIAQFVGEVRYPFHFVVVGIAALLGGYLGSEALGTLSTWGPEFEGLYVLPALIGGLIVGGAVDAIVRYSTDGSYMAAPRPI
jgi:uncharacterized membrane protein YeaQ/YmgE (transglycosylase-associated protein family)